MKELADEAIKMIDARISDQPDSRCASSDEIYMAAMVCRIQELEEGLSKVRGLICDGAKEGFNCHEGDWADRLFKSNQETSRLLDR